MAAKLLVFAVLINASLAFLWQRQHPVAQAEDRAVDPACLAHIQTGNCEFYRCFEQRLGCGRDYYIQKYGYHYCNKTESRRNRFTTAGQQFLTNIKSCLMTPLQEIYTRDYINCHDLEHEAVMAIAPCFQEHNFCAVLRTDAEEFFRLYRFDDLLSRGAGKVWRAIFTIATQCGSQYTREFTSEVAETFLSSVNNFFSSLGNLEPPSLNLFGSDETEEAV